MKNLIILSICFILLISYSRAQNLVPNPSFEIYEECPDYWTVEPVKSFIPNWYLPTKGTSDYFNSCSRFQVNVPNNFIGHMLAKDGQAYAGIIIIKKPQEDSNKSKEKDYREYLQTELKEPLILGKSYEVKFYYCIATYSTYAVNNIGIYISKDRIKYKRSSNILLFSPQIKADTNKINTVKDKWFEVSDTFIAEGGEKHLIIGNFYSNIDTQYATLDRTGIRKTLRTTIEENKIAYYYIDMVSVTLIED